MPKALVRRKVRGCSLLLIWRGLRRSRPDAHKPAFADFGSSMGNARHPKRAASAEAIEDLASGLGLWWMWGTMAWQDIRQRYRGSVLGPLWLTLSMGIMILALGILYSTLFRVSRVDFIPFFALGLIAWMLLAVIAIEGCYTFTAANSVIKQVKLPYSILVYRVVWRNVIVFTHNVAIYVVVAVYFDIKASAEMLLVVPGLAVVLFNGVWLAFFLGMVCARFRDIPQIVANIIQIMFFLTPIIWMPELLGENQIFAYANPFFALVELIRAPLLGRAPLAVSWEVALATALVGGSFTFLFFRRFRSRIAYWA
jgi:lipopolysaccharide transport system permease protein